MTIRIITPLLLIIIMQSALAYAAPEPMQEPSTEQTGEDTSGRVEIAPSFDGFAPEGSSGEVVDLPAYMDSIGTDATEWYQHVQTLANPWFEGRQPGTPGGRRTAEYIAWYLDQAGCRPIFETASDPVRMGMWSNDPDGPSWYQPFEFNPRRSSRSLTDASMILGDVAVGTGKGFNVLGNSGSGSATAPITFVGYAIEDGPEGYSSFGESDDLTGRIALLLRYEPLDEDGNSQWSEQDFSEHHGLEPKFNALIERGAAGIILVNPPGATDGRSGLESFRRTRRLRPTMDIPTVHAHGDAIDLFLKHADEQGRTIAQLRALADSGSSTAIDFKEDHLATLTTSIDTGMYDAQNVAAVHEGRGALADQWVVIGGHFDHLGHGYLGSRAPRSTETHYGADDNASGTGAILQLAKRLALNDDGEGDRRSILFIGFDAEEAGLYGSDYFLEHCPLEHDSITAMLNMDMMGRLRDNQVSVTGTGTAVEFEEMLPRVVEPTGLIIRATPGGMGPSDHSNFYKRDIPVLFFYTGDHDDYHTPRDLAWTVNPEGTARIIDLAGTLAEEIARRPEPLTFQTATGTGTARRTGAKVRLGIMPNYTSDLDTGVLVDGVSDGTSAMDAGIVTGDILLRWNDIDLTDGSVLMQQLVQHQPGDVINIRVRRGNKDIDLPVTLKARDGS